MTEAGVCEGQDDVEVRRRESEEASEEERGPLYNSILRLPGNNTPLFSLRLKCALPVSAWSTFSGIPVTRVLQERAVIGRSAPRVHLL